MSSCLDKESEKNEKDDNDNKNDNDNDDNDVKDFATKMCFGSHEEIIYGWKQIIVELVGTAMLVMLGTGSAIGAIHYHGMEAAANLSFALGFGYAVAACIYATANVSGGHLNPAITLGMLLLYKISILKGSLYILAQLVGAILGSAFVMGAFPEEVGRALNYGANSLATRTVYFNNQTITYTVTQGNGIFIEFLITFFLVWVVFATVQLPGDKHHQGRMAPVAIGFAVLVSHLFAGSWTGCSMNPARSFGPAVISGYWDDHWVFWVGPFVGAIAASLFYRFVQEKDYKPDYSKYVPFL